MSEEKKLSLKTLKAENDELREMLKTAVSKIDSLSQSQSAQATHPEDNFRERQNIQRMERDLENAREKLQNQHDAFNKGKYAYRVKHYAHPLSSRPKQHEDQRRWGAEDVRKPFRCDEPDARAAERVYRERMGLRGALSQQLILERIDEDK